MTCYEKLGVLRFRGIPKAHFCNSPSADYLPFVSLGLKERKICFPIPYPRNPNLEMQTQLQHSYSQCCFQRSICLMAPSFSVAANAPCSVIYGNIRVFLFIHHYPHLFFFFIIMIKPAIRNIFLIIYTGLRKL